MASSLAAVHLGQASLATRSGHSSQEGGLCRGMSLKSSYQRQLSFGDGVTGATFTGWRGEGGMCHGARGARPAPLGPSLPVHHGAEPGGQAPEL